MKRLSLSSLGIAFAQMPGTMVDIAVVNEGVGTLVAAVTEAETLSSEDPFTAFAPTDDTFAATLEALGITIEELLASEGLSGILT